MAGMEWVDSVDLKVGDMIALGRIVAVRQTAARVYTTVARSGDRPDYEHWHSKRTKVAVFHDLPSADG